MKKIFCLLAVLAAFACNEIPEPVVPEEPGDSEQPGEVVPEPEPPVEEVSPTMVSLNGTEEFAGYTLVSVGLYEDDVKIAEKRPEGVCTIAASEKYEFDLGGYGTAGVCG